MEYDVKLGSRQMKSQSCSWLIVLKQACYSQFGQKYCQFYKDLITFISQHKFGKSKAVGVDVRRNIKNVVKLYLILHSLLQTLRYEPHILTMPLTRPQVEKLVAMVLHPGKQSPQPGPLALLQEEPCPPLAHDDQVRRPCNGLLQSLHHLQLHFLCVNQCKVNDCGFGQNFICAVQNYLFVCHVRRDLFCEVGGFYL